MLARVLSKLIELMLPPLCIACGADAGRAAPVCRACRAQMEATAPRGSATPWGAFAYDGPAGALVRALKFGGRVAIADVMAAQIAALAPPELLQGVVVPVPVHPAHSRRRGVDHAAALARALARRSRLPFADCLVRSGDPRPQVGRGRAARVRGPAGAISLRAGWTAPPERVLLVDDVVTTGATLAACAGALREAGSRQITTIVYARTTAR
ncbi:MAG TPA: double zinc ribbon domain-containing protein [Thermoleophilaceae bacterium]|nr:double zinc ribbon domain-containing protein [Thermoleophilaceae bacterium]